MTAARNLILLLALGVVVVVSEILLAILGPVARKHDDYEELWTMSDDPGRDVDEED